MTARHYQHQTCALHLESQLAPAGQTQFSLSYPFQTVVQLSKASLQGDGHLARDLVTVLDRYLQAYLRGEPQGMFSSTVAIRPVDFLTQRLTIREGEGIKQVDLTMTELYDLAEVLADFREEYPQIVEWAPKPARTLKVKAPAAIAAVVVGAIGIGVGVWNQQRLAQNPQETQTAETTTVEVPAAPDDPEQLRQRLLAAWRTPTDLPQELVYQVLLDPQGQILSAVPQDQTSAQSQLLTPFAAAPNQEPETIPEGSQRFTVRLGELNRVVVESN
ncbi:MAG: DUF4335 domain-containing protein [Thermostichales cyanobacterium SZTDM-1c_bins_54]